MSCIKIASPMVPMVKYIHFELDHGEVGYEHPNQHSVWIKWDFGTRLKESQRQGPGENIRKSQKEVMGIDGNFSGDFDVWEVFFLEVLLMMGFYSCSTLSCFSKFSTFGMATHTPK